MRAMQLRTHYGVPHVSYLFAGIVLTEVWKENFQFYSVIAIFGMNIAVSQYCN